MRNLVMAAMLAPLFTGAAGAAGDPAVLPPGGAAVLMWTPEQQAWGYKNKERIGPVHVIDTGRRAQPVAPFSNRAA